MNKRTGIERLIITKTKNCLLDEEDSPRDSKEDDSIVYRAIKEYMNELRAEGCSKRYIKRIEAFWKEKYLDRKAMIREDYDKDAKEEAK